MTDEAANPVPCPSGAASSETSCTWDMSVLELAIFMCIFRAERSMTVEETCAVIDGWFECSLDSATTRERLCRMAEAGWLHAENAGFCSTHDGRRAARPMMNGLIRLLDNGTRLVDVALMMTVLRLTRGELDDAAADR